MTARGVRGEAKGGGIQRRDTKSSLLEKEEEEEGCELLWNQAGLCKGRFGTGLQRKTSGRTMINSWRKRKHQDTLQKMKIHEL